MITKEQVIEKLKLVEDPELHLDIWTLGMIYDISIKEDGVDILMTLTSALCPFADKLVENAEKKVGELYEGKEGMVRIELTFDPPWEANEELRMILGI